MRSHDSTTKSMNSSTTTTTTTTTPPNPAAKRPLPRNSKSFSSAAPSTAPDRILRKKTSITFTAVTRAARTSTPSSARNSRNSGISSSSTSTRPTSSNPTSALTSTSTAPLPARTPLSQIRQDENKMRSTSSKTPFERPATSTTPSSRQQPQMPTLAKRLTGAPNKITPKITAKPTTNPSQQGQRQTVTVATPAPRRLAPRPESARPESVLSSNVGYNGGSRSGARELQGPVLAVLKDKDKDKDDFASPISAFLHNNVTPRSGSRQSRVQSTNNSPTPADVQDAWETRSGLGLGITAPSLDAEGPRRNPVAFASAPTGRRQEHTLQPSADRDSKFFYASDANAKSKPQSKPPPLQPRPLSEQQKGPTFFYANGDNLPGKPAALHVASPPFSPGLASLTPDPLSNKFVYANGSDLQPSLMSSAPGSVVSTTSRITGSKVGSGRQSPVLLPQRDPPPVKMPSYAPPPPVAQTAGAPTLAERRSKTATAPQLGQPIPALRRISLETPPRAPSGHSRSGSLITEPPSVSRILSASTSSDSPVSSPLAFSNPGLSLASMLQAADEMVEQDDNESLLSGLTSPKSQHGNDPLNELVANARRERKVQDLQITNASLEAINRTLERQLRKQTTELRRFKRLARAGRLSSINNTTASSSRVVSASTDGDAPQGPLNSLDLSDLSEEGSDLDDEDGDLDGSELSDSQESAGMAEQSPNTMADRDARHRKRDQKRLHIDLSKHQELLVDSQKMNQSLKRCLGWTEELIREGKRALEYQVKFTDDEMEGRGSAANETGERYVYDGAALFDRDSDMSPGHDNEVSLSLRLERVQTKGNAESKPPQDRDSAIVLPGDGG